MANSVMTGFPNLSGVTHDSGNHMSAKRQERISAPEVELFSDMPVLLDGTTTNAASVFERARVFDVQPSYSPSTPQRQPPPAPPPPPQWNQPTYPQIPPVQSSQHNVFQQDRNDQQLTSSVDKLLERYAPDATPTGATNLMNNPRPPPQVNIVTSRQQPTSFSSNIQFPPFTDDTSNYATFNRQPFRGTSQSETNINANQQPSARPQSSAVYDSFQPGRPQQHQQPQQQTQTPQSFPTTTGNFAQVVPGKLYTADDDPLHILYDRQEPAHANQQPPLPQHSSFNGTFQLPSTFQVVPQPFATLGPQHAVSGSAINLEREGALKAFDLGNFIKDIQQDYLRQIQPYVSSVKFIEKDQQYGQSLNDIGLTEPMTIHKGFTSQADDLLHRSFGNHDHQGSHDRGYYIHSNNGDRNSYPSGYHQYPLRETDSNLSYASTSSISAAGGDHNDHRLSGHQRTKHQYHDQGTSPPNKRSQPPQFQMPSTGSIPMPGKVSVTNKSENEHSPVQLKQARRLPSNASTSSAATGDGTGHSARYSAYDKPGHAINTLFTSEPLLPPSTGVFPKQEGPQHSENIHPKPPTVSPTSGQTSPPTKTQTALNHSEDSDTIGSDEGSDYESNESTPVPQQSNQGSAQPTRGAPAAAAPTRGAPAAAAATPTRGAPPAAAATPTRGAPPAAAATPTRGAPAAAATPARGAPAAAATPARGAPAAPADAAAAGDDAAAATPARGAPAAPAAAPSRGPATSAASPSRGPSTSAAAPPRGPGAGHQSGPPGAAAAPSTGSFRFFDPQGSSIFGGKNAIKDAPARIGNKFKSLTSKVFKRSN